MTPTPAALVALLHADAVRHAVERAERRESEGRVVSREDIRLLIAGAKAGVTAADALAGEARDVAKVAVEIRRCTQHNFYAVIVGDARITPTKCCGSWDQLVRRWDDASAESIINAARAATEG